MSNKKAKHQAECMKRSEQDLGQRTTIERDFVEQNLGAVATTIERDFVEQNLGAVATTIERDFVEQNLGAVATTIKEVFPCP